MKILTLENALRGLLNGTVTPNQATELLSHLDKKYDAIVLPPNFSEEARADTIVTTLERCVQQDDRWGATRAYPSFHPVVLADGDSTPKTLAGFHEVPSGERARLLTQHQDAEGQLSWMTILTEEVAKLTEKVDDREALRDQLADVAAVALQWSVALHKPTEVPVMENGNVERAG